jgi:predicted metal-dependent peptidase
LCGGGGTDFCPPFQYVQDQGIRPECLVYLTDLYGPFPAAPEYPTLWCSTTSQVAPFGTTIEIEV